MANAKEEKKLEVPEWYTRILTRAYCGLVIWERVISQYPVDDNYEINDTPFSESDSKDPITLMMKQVSPIKECHHENNKDIFNACSLRHHFDAVWHLRSLGISAYELDLRGEFLHQMQDLNKYVFSVVSTNDPQIKWFNWRSGREPNHLFVEFYTTETIAMKLLNFITTEHKDYEYEIVYPMYKYFIFNERSETKLNRVDGKWVKETKVIGKLDGQYKEPLSGERRDTGFSAGSDEDHKHVLEDLAYVAIVDGNTERRDLYQILVNFFQDTKLSSIPGPLYDEKSAKQILLDDLRLDRKIKWQTQPDAITLRSSDSKDIVMAYHNAIESLMLKDTLETPGNTEDTSDWSEEKILTNPPLAIVVLIDIPYEYLKVIGMYLKHQLPPSDNESERSDFTEEFVRRVFLGNTPQFRGEFKEVVEYFDIPQLLKTLTQL